MPKIKKLLPFFLILEVLVLIFAYFEANGDTTHFFQASARHSGRVSLLSFSILLVYSTLNREFVGEILSTKYILARDFAILHIIHWFLLATAVKLSGFELVPSRVAGGSLAYLIIVILPFILSGKILQKLSLKWLMHVYLFYVWFIFFMTYVSRVNGSATNITGSMPTYWVLITFTSLLMIWRIIYLATIRRSKNNG